MQKLQSRQGTLTKVSLRKMQKSDRDKAPWPKFSFGTRIKTWYVLCHCLDLSSATCVKLKRIYYTYVGRSPDRKICLCLPFTPVFTPTKRTARNIFWIRLSPNQNNAQEGFRQVWFNVEMALEKKLFRSKPHKSQIAYMCSLNRSGPFVCVYKS